MRKLFGHKPKGKPALARDSEAPPPITTPLYQKLATYGNNVHIIPSTEEESPQRQLPAINVPSRTPSYSSILPNTSPIASADPPLPPRSGSPASLAHTLTSLPPTLTNVSTAKLSKDRRKNPNQTSAPVALSILRALEPPRPESKLISNRSQSEERYTISESGHSLRDRDRDSGEKKEKRSFWGVRDKDREKEKEREREVILQREKDRGGERTGDRLGERERDRGREIWREDDGATKLTHMIGYLTATAAEDWTLLMDVCDRASASEANAKAAVRALRSEFKYGAPPAQLSAARLWAIMLRNSSEIFISQSTSRKFLDTLEELLSSPRTSPVVRERVLEVVAAAAFASGNKKDVRHEKDGFRGLWKRVRPLDKPEEGIPFDTEDAMFQPPNTAQGPGYEVPFYQEPTVDSSPITPVLRANKRRSPVRHRIITPDEDIRRLFQECVIGRGNAGLLSEALAHSKPEDLKKKDVIKEFYDKCRLSQELICAQIPWASAGAEHSRAMKDKGGNRTDSSDLNHTIEDGRVSVEQTVEEALLAALLMANADLLEALKQYDDLERVAIERQTEERSRKEVRMERKHRDIENLSLSELSVSSRPSTPHSRPHTPQPLNLAQPHPQQPPLSVADNDSIFLSQNLAFPPAAPHGPRSPAPISLHTRTPSPGPQGLDFSTNGHDVYKDIQSPSLNGIGHDHPSAQPSAKALGKRKLVEPESLSDPHDDVDATYFDKEHAFPSGDGADPEFEDENDRWNHPAVHFVYDAVAERTRQRLEGREELVDNRVH